MTFREAFPDAKGMPDDLDANDYSFEWKPDGTLCIIETLFVPARYEGFDIHVSKDLQRKLASEKIVREFPPQDAPEVDDDGLGFNAFPG